MTKEEYIPYATPIPERWYVNAWTNFGEGTYLYSDLLKMGWIESKIGNILLFHNGSEREGFQFIALSFSCKTSTETELDLLLHGYAYFDGIRHINFGEGGYLHYPHLTSLITLFTKLRELELEHCKGSK